MRCARDPSCVATDGHADLCLKIDGSAILKRRDAYTAQMIADARGPEETPLDAFDRTMMGEIDATIDHHAEVLAAHPPADPVLTLTGDEAHHYRRLQAAAKRALDTQNAHATAGADLREAIQALCKVMAPGA